MYAQAMIVGSKVIDRYSHGSTVRNNCWLKKYADRILGSRLFVYDTWVRWLTDIFCSSDQRLHLLTFLYLDGETKVGNLDVQGSLSIEENVLWLQEASVCVCEVHES